jgi:hypothetical protein
MTTKTMRLRHIADDLYNEGLITAGDSVNAVITERDSLLSVLKEIIASVDQDKRNEAMLCADYYLKACVAIEKCTENMR